MNIQPQPSKQAEDIAASLYWIARGQSGVTLKLTDWGASDGVHSGRGYVVGGKLPGIKLTNVYDNPLGKVALIARWVQALPLYTEYVGSWVDDDGTLYVDANDILSDRAEAIALGQERGELAIYDLGKGEEIDLSRVRLVVGPRGGRIVEEV